MDINQTGNSKERREQLKREIDELGKNLPFKFEKNSQLRILKALCTYIKKSKHFSRINQMSSDHDHFFPNTELNSDQISPGFLTCFTKNGDLVYISENISDYFGINALDVLFAYDNILEIPCKHDTAVFSELLRNYRNYAGQEKISFYSSWFVSRIQKRTIYLNEYKQFKMSGHYDTKTELFVFSCQPVLSNSNRDVLTITNAECFRTTHKLNLQMLDYTSAFYEFLGYNSTDFQEVFNLYRLISPDSLETVIKRHKDLLLVKNTRGYTDRIKLIHRNGGYTDCLLNMYYDPKGFIVCVYQIFNNEDIEKYIDYMSLFNCAKNVEYDAETGEELSQSDGQTVAKKVEILYESDSSNSSPPTIKHKYEEIRDEEENMTKRAKHDLETSEALDIYNIEEALKREIYSSGFQESALFSNFYLAGQSANGEDNCRNETQNETDLNTFDFEDQFLQDCDLQHFQQLYDISTNSLTDSNEKLCINNQYLADNYYNNIINNNNNNNIFFNTFYDRQIF